MALHSIPTPDKSRPIESTSIHSTAVQFALRPSTHSHSHTFTLMSDTHTHSVCPTQARGDSTIHTHTHESSSRTMTHILRQFAHKFYDTHNGNNMMCRLTRTPSRTNNQQPTTNNVNSIRFDSARFDSLPCVCVSARY